MSALYSLAPSLQVTANNLANVNTNGFKAGVTRFETGPRDQGVRISEITKDAKPGAFIEHPLFIEEDGRVKQRMGWVESSNTDIAREFTNMISVEKAYLANLASIRTADEMLGSIFNEWA